mgnify:CR=1 FL=1
MRQIHTIQYIDKHKKPPINSIDSSYYIPISTLIYHNQTNINKPEQQKSNEWKRKYIMRQIHTLQYIENKRNVL